MFRDVYARIENGSNSWRSLNAPDDQLYPWDPKSTYIRKPPFFDGMTRVNILFILNRQFIISAITKFLF